MSSVMRNTAEWDVISMQRLHDESNIPVRRILGHLQCHAGDWQTDLSLDEYVQVSVSSLKRTVDELERRCRQRFGRELPFECATLHGCEHYRMSLHIAAIVWEVM